MRKKERKEKKRNKGRYDRERKGERSFLFRME